MGTIAKRRIGVAIEAAPTVDPGPGLHGYHPEMGEAKPVTQFEASLSHYGKHYFVKTPPQFDLKGQGIKLTQTYKASDLVPEAQHKVGWHLYKVTVNAFKKLKAEYSIGYEMLLD